MHRLVEFGALLGNAAAESRRPDSSHSMDPSRHGGLAFGDRFGRRISRAGGLVSGYDADRLRHFQYARVLSRCRAHSRRRTPLSDLSRRDSRRGSEYFHRAVHGTGRLVPHPGRRGNRRSEVRSRLVSELGARLGRIRQSFRRARHHGSLLLHNHDVAVQSARSRAGLAEGNIKW